MAIMLHPFKNLPGQSLMLCIVGSQLCGSFERIEDHRHVLIVFFHSRSFTSFKLKVSESLTHYCHAKHWRFFCHRFWGCDECWRFSLSGICWVGTKSLQQNAALQNLAKTLEPTNSHIWQLDSMMFWSACIRVTTLRPCPPLLCNKPLSIQSCLIEGQSVLWLRLG